MIIEWSRNKLGPLLVQLQKKTTAVSTAILNNNNLPTSGEIEPRNPIIK